MITTDDTVLEIDQLPDFRTTRLFALSHLIYLDGNNILRLISALTDHEGQLSVEWKVEPTLSEKKRVSEKWTEVGEDSTNTTHLLDGERI